MSGCHEVISCNTHVSNFHAAALYCEFLFIRRRHLRNKKCQEKSVSSPSPPVPGIAFAELWIDFRRSFACARYLRVTWCLAIRNNVLPLSASQI